MYSQRSAFKTMLFPLRQLHLPSVFAGWHSLSDVFGDARYTVSTPVPSAATSSKFVLP